eukprot:TRINITY_DN17206_c0_g1_i1.p1 TRINITY_DN17206_c0_g1~~TRINITY_DN17206_c0_g1_i1.p1  ORF type:complete len:279 (-),score=44.32 TRINITY_DN17206_c0_g1_i1:83-919(-)
MDYNIPCDHFQPQFYRPQKCMTCFHSKSLHSKSRPVVTPQLPITGDWWITQLPQLKVSKQIDSALLQTFVETSSSGDFGDLEDDDADEPNHWASNSSGSVSDWYSSTEEEPTDEPQQKQKMGLQAIEEQTQNSDWLIASRAHLQLGMIYLHGFGAESIKKDVTVAFEHFFKAHKLQHPRGSYRVGELVSSGEAPPPYSKKDPRIYFRAALQTFCEQLKVNGNGNSLAFYGDFDTQYMLNDFRAGIRKYQLFYQEALARKDENKFLKDLLDFATTSVDN